ncbi:MAG: hypothetical protein AB1941_05455 [Gemmatimonadota bacterium]
MYSTCIFCHAPLGANEAIEQFPVGRRLAFDGAKGRLWVVCRACGRWNLSPLETRWEAVEACERTFRDTRVRVSTENVGLARLHEGTELVRIGAPLRPEFAAWRYGDQFGARARRMWTRGIGVGGLGAAAAGAALAANPMLLLLAPTWLLLLKVFRDHYSRPWSRASGAYRALRTTGGKPLLRHRDEAVVGARVLADAENRAGWQLEVRTDRLHTLDVGYRKHRLVGPAAMQAASVILAQANAWGASRQRVQSAVAHMEEAGDPERYMKAIGKQVGKAGRGGRDLWKLPQQLRLAMEMAVHEDAERRAMEGELAELERRWRAAEEIASIADRLAVPPEVESRLERMKRRKPKA